MVVYCRPGHNLTPNCRAGSRQFPCPCTRLLIGGGVVAVVVVAVVVVAVVVVGIAGRRG